MWATILTALGKFASGLVQFFVNRNDEQKAAAYAKSQEIYRAPDTPVNEYISAYERMRELEQAGGVAESSEPKDSL